MLFDHLRHRLGAVAGAFGTAAWAGRSGTVLPGHSSSPSPTRSWEQVAAAIGVAALLAAAVPVYFPSTTGEGRDTVAARDQRIEADRRGALTDNELLLGGYVGVPYHPNSEMTLDRPNGTNVTLKGIEWYGEPFKFPLYAGVRATQWRGPFGFMIEFLHDKAVARTGKGAHGSRVTGERAIPQMVETFGKIKGADTPAQMKITDVLDRLEFTHGHNMLLPTLMMRLGALTPQLRPYVGFGAGMALPHVEVWPAGEDEPSRTNEYQIAGPAMQALFGLEIRTAWGSYFLEYKYTFAWLSLALTGGKTPKWCNCDAVSDMWRQFWQWWQSEPPRYGRAHVTLATHQVVGGAAYRVPPRVPAQ